MLLRQESDDERQAESCRLEKSEGEMNRRRLLKVMVSVAFASASRAAFANGWPKDRVIRAVVPFNPGASIDIIGRICADALSRRLGQTIIVENRSGAGGTIGSEYVARADPDGYTLLINASNQTVVPALYKNLPFDTATDFAVVALFGTVPNVLLVFPGAGYKSVQDLVAKAKSKDLYFSSSGVGSASHWAAERFLISAEVKATHVPFRSGLEALTEVMTGRVDFCCIGISAAIAFIRDKKVEPLCVTTLKRSPSLPDVVTSVEAGYKDSDYNFWNGLLVPAKTPRPIIERLSVEVAAILAMPDVQRKLNLQGVEPSPVTPEQFGAQIRQEIAQNLTIAQQAGVQPM
jgi:tripartite-type tricarboxylate transporter receptor subunit TctC